MAIEFVHIPKSGGTALERNLPKTCGKRFKGFGHNTTSQMVTSRGDHALVVLREPEDRFRSSYSYWKNGSADIERFQRKGLHKPSEKLNTIGIFIDAAANATHPDHKLALEAMNKSDDYTWKVHFDPQSKWIDNSHPDRTHIICYDKDNLPQNVSDVLQNDLDIDCDLSRLPKVNVTSSKDTDALTDAQSSWLRNKYSSDFQLWQDHCA